MPLRLHPRDAATTEALVLAAQAGRAEALAVLVELHGPALARTARALVGASAAPDCQQEAWLAITRGIHRLRDPERFLPFAYRILTHKCRDAIRRAQRDRRISSTVSGSGSSPEPLTDDRTAGAPDDAAQVRAAVASLPGDLRDVAVLFYAADLGVVSISAVLGIPPGTVKSRLHTARATLRRRLASTQEPGEEPGKGARHE